MADKLKEIPAKILEWWNKFTTRQKSIIIGAAAVVIFAFAIIMYVMSKPQYVRLVTCETTAQASEIIDTLDSAGIAHRESNDGLKIDVESSQQSAANLALGSAGYVPDALNLNDYLGNSMSTTATDKERLYNSYLEQYITQTIEAQSAVKSAKVHLSFPKDNGTLAAQNEEASAFIQLELMVRLHPRMQQRWQSVLLHGCGMIPRRILPLWILIPICCLQAVTITHPQALPIPCRNYRTRQNP